jgi:hypothetical protein
MQVLFEPGVCNNETIKVLYGIFVALSLVCGSVSVGFHVHHIRAFSHALKAIVAAKNPNSNASEVDENASYIMNLEWEEKKIARDIRMTATSLLTLAFEQLPMVRASQPSSEACCAICCNHA